MIFDHPAAAQNPMLSDGLYWFGAGLFVDDLPDIPPRLREVLEGYLAWWTRKDEVKRASNGVIASLERCF